MTSRVLEEVSFRNNSTSFKRNREIDKEDTAAAAASSPQQARRSSGFFEPTLTSWRKKYLNDVLKILGCVLFYVLCVWYYNSSLGWSITTCIYFVTCSITTVGYGDFTPETNEDRVFTMFMLLVGLLLVFSTINDFANYIIRTAEEKALARLDDDPTDLRAPHAWKIFLSIMMILFCLAIGTIFFMMNEDADFVKALYFSLVTTVTVGYGDFDLQHQSTRVFLIFYIFFSVIIVAGALGNFGSVKMEMAFEKRKIELLEKELDLQAILDMDQDGDGVDRVEFLTAMLVQINGLSKEKDIDPWLRRFDELDADKSGMLDEDDLKLFASQESEKAQHRLSRVFESSERDTASSVESDTPHHEPQSNTQKIVELSPPDTIIREEGEV